MARAARQLVLMQAVDPRQGDHEGLPSLGSLAEVTAALRRYNTAPDGGAPKNGVGGVVMFGPGLYMEMALVDDEIKQVMVTMTDDDFAFPVLMRLCREQRWTMLDPETGRRFGP